MHDHRASAGKGAVREQKAGSMTDKNVATAWQVSRGPIKADRYTLEAARSIDAMLTVPIAVLPKIEGDLVLPFRVGIGTDIETLLRPDASRSELRKALRRYTHSAGYLYASAQPDAYRHEINGEAVGLVSEEDRINARQSFLKVQEMRKQRRKQRQASEPKDLVR